MNSGRRRNVRWSAEDLARDGRLEIKGDQARPIVRAPATMHGNIRTIANGIPFPSQLQARHYQHFQLQLAAGAIRGYAHEVSIPIGNSQHRIRIDHMVTELEGGKIIIRWYDSKGWATKQWHMKRNMVERQLGIRIELLTAKDAR